MARKTVSLIMQSKKGQSLIESIFLISFVMLFAVFFDAFRINANKSIKKQRFHKIQKRSKLSYKKSVKAIFNQKGGVPWNK